MRGAKGGSGTTLVRDLTRAEWRARRRTYLVLVTLLGATSATYFLVLALVGGMEERIGSELSDTLVGDLRIATGKTGLGDGEVMTDYRDRIAGLRYRVPDARIAPRLEVEALFLHGTDFSGSLERPNVTRTTGILIGIDPAEDASVAPLAPYIARGIDLSAPGGPWLTPSGEPLVPIVAGEGFLEASNVTVATSGSFSWGAVYNITAGRFENGQPVKVRAVVVGSFSTGFNIIDRFVVYMPRGEVGRLLGHHPTEPPANVLLARTAEPDVLADAAPAQGLATITPEAFRQGYLGPVFTAVRAFSWGLIALLSVMTAGWIAHTLGHHVRSDARKIATLRAIGVPHASVARAYLQVAGLLGIIGGLAGVAAGALVILLAQASVGLLERSTLLVPSGHLLDAVAMVFLSSVTALLAAAVALRRVRRIPIREALHAP